MEHRWEQLHGIAPSGFEPLSQAPKARMLGHYTTGLRHRLKSTEFIAWHRGDE